MAEKTLKVVVVGDIKNAQKAFDRLAQDAGTLQSKMKDIGGRLTSAGRGLTTGLTLPIIGIGVASVKAAGVSEAAQAQLANAVESMSAATWTSVDALNARAAALQDVTAFDDEAVNGFQALLLTFGKVKNEVGEGNDIFDQATRLGLDMAQALGTDANGAALQLGKALNDPTKGVTALSRAGVSFTQQQKDQIKALQASGDMVGAQKIILAELEKQFGGSAQAFAETTDGQLAQSMNALGNAAEGFGAVLAPLLKDFAAWIKDVAAKFEALSPGAKKMIVIGAGIAAAIGPLLLIFGGLATVIGAVSAPVLAVVAAAGLLVAGLVYAYNHSETFRLAVDRLRAVIADKILPVLRELWERALPYIQAAFKVVGDVLGWLLNRFLDDMAGIGRAVGTVIDWVQRLIDGFKTAKAVFAELGFWGVLKEGFRAALNWIIGKWNDFKLTLGGGSILGVNIPSVTLNTPNIPTLHDGGVFRAPTRGGEGLALLRDGERVLTPEQDARVVVNVATDADPWQIASAVAWQLKTAGV